MIYKTHDGLDMYYEIQGNASSAEYIVFLNGLTQSTISWALMTPYFKENYKLILIDFIFQGQSSKEGDWRDFDQHAKDIKGLLEIEGINKVHLVGLSYGSFVAQHFAVNHPEMLRKLVLISTVAHKNPYFEAIELSWENALKYGGYNLLLDIMLPNVLSEEYFLNPLIPIEVMKTARKDLNQNTGAILKLMKATKERVDYRRALQKILSPTLIIQGEKDTLLPVHMANEVHLNIKNSKFVVVPNAGHTLNLE
ncbi:MAG: alpha/beta hydrolase, partial [Bacteroidia bacterium]|nr:alpha/beta hydrolase [Bacteroidia bacterium]